MTTFDIDLLSREALQNPHPIFSEIRQNHPVFTATDTTPG